MAKLFQIDGKKKFSNPFHLLTCFNFSFSFFFVVVDFSSLQVGYLTGYNLRRCRPLETFSFFDSYLALGVLQSPFVLMPR